MVKKPVSKNGKNAAKKAGLGAGINKAAENYAENVVFLQKEGMDLLPKRRTICMTRLWAKMLNLLVPIM